jgi:hypothetical protein
MGTAFTGWHVDGFVVLLRRDFVVMGFYRGFLSIEQSLPPQAKNLGLHIFTYAIQPSLHKNYAVEIE